MNIAFVGQQHYFNCAVPMAMDGHRLYVLNVNGDLSNKTRYASVLALNKEKDIDVWFFFRGEFLHHDYAKQLKGVKVNISTEPIQRSDTPFCLQHTKGKFDKFFHYDKTHIPWIEKTQNIKVDGEFQLPVNLDLYRYLELPQQWDVGFIGRSTDSRERHFDQFTPRREQYMSTLKHLTKFLHVSHGLFEEELIRILNMIKIHLNIHIGTYPQLQHRVQNAVACKQFVLSERLSHNDDLEEYKHFVPFLNASDLVEKVDYYLEHENERKKIAQQGYDYVTKRFNAETEWAKLIDKVIK